MCNFRTINARCDRVNLLDRFEKCVAGGDSDIPLF